MVCPVLRFNVLSSVDCPAILRSLIRLALILNYVLCVVVHYLPTTNISLTAKVDESTTLTVIFFLQIPLLPTYSITTQERLPACPESELRMFPELFYNCLYHLCFSVIKPLPYIVFTAFRLTLTFLYIASLTVTLFDYN